MIDDNNGSLIPFTTPKILGSPVFFKGTIAGLSGQGAPTGTVNVLMDGTTSLGTATLTVDGGYLIESTAATIGAHTIVVQYSGDNSFNSTTSSPQTFTVGLGGARTYMETGGSVLAALLSVSGTAVPTGTIQMFDNDVAVSAPMPVVTTGILGSGIPQVGIPYTFTAGVHTIYALYSGDSNYAPSTLADGTAVERVLHVGSTGTTPSAVTFSMTTKSPLPQGQMVTFLFKVASESSTTNVAPTGSISANIQGTQGSICEAIISSTNGTASANCYANAAGEFTLQAYYSGDSTYVPSLSTNTISLSIPKLTQVPTIITSAAYALPNSQVTLGATVNSVMVNAYNKQDPVGTFTFMDSVNGAAATSLGTFNIQPINGLVAGYTGRFTLPTGVNLITVMFSGNPNFNATSATTTITVGSPDFLFTSNKNGLSIAAGSTGSTTLSLTPTLNYAGTVVLACGSGVPAGATCSVTPSSASLTSAQTATVTITTLVTSPSVSSALHSSPFDRPLEITSLAGLFLILLHPKTRRRLPALLPLLCIGITVALSGCGGTPTPKATLLAINSSSIKSASGGSITFTANLSALENNPTGTVTFYDGKTALGSASLTAGSTSVTTSALSVGGHTITAVYSGDTNNSPSTSTALTQVVTGTTTLQVTATAGSIVHTISLPLTLN